MNRILAIDYGMRRIGLAISDETRTIAQGLKTIDCAVKGASGALAEITGIVSGHEVGLIILGYPTSMNGKPSTRGNEVEVFKATLEKAIKVPIELVDERFTTALAHRYIGEAGKKVRPDRQPVDMVAATVLLEDYLQSEESGIGDLESVSEEEEPVIGGLGPENEDEVSGVEGPGSGEDEAT
jgi:putative Holliday junction resolvase